MIRCKKCHLTQCTCGAEDWEDYQTCGEAKAENASLRIQNEQLRQRVAELEQQLTDVRKQEREKCAKACAELSDYYSQCYRVRESIGAAKCCEIIRQTEAETK